MTDKKTAAQKIKSFLLTAGSKVGEKISDAVIAGLIAYVEGLIKGRT